MKLNSLTAISPIDGRYRQQVNQLEEYFSEYALIKYRVHVEIQYLLFLHESKIFNLTTKAKKTLLKIDSEFDNSKAQIIKDLEATTNHDVKAVEYFIKDELKKSGDSAIAEWVHFALTSQDINNTAIPLSWKHAIEFNYLPAVLNLSTQLLLLAKRWGNIPVLAHTHGQPASPTRLGKEMMVFVERIQNQIDLLVTIPFTAKFGGATGNFNAHHVSFPKTNWIKFANNFVNKKLGLSRIQYSTQIEHYDNLAAHFDGMKRINTVLIDLCRDFWTYISMNYFNQKINEKEVGSSAMPHKVNPIDFENAEGNFGVAQSLFEHFARKLTVSRLQRDLSDSTTMRNIGVAFGHLILGLKAVESGFDRLQLNEGAMAKSLDGHWEVLGEAVQSLLRLRGIDGAYARMKSATRGLKMNRDEYIRLIGELSAMPDVAEVLGADDLRRLTALTPAAYYGASEHLAGLFFEAWQKRQSGGQS